MALIEKKLADRIVELRAQNALGHEYCRADETAELLEEAMHELQRQRAIITEETAAK